jgi:hypothetical protein
MEHGEKSDKQTILRQIKIGDYIKWRPLPVDQITERVFTEFKNFSWGDNEWQYGIVLDMLDCPRNKDDKDSIQGLHVQILQGNEIDWIFNFELFNEIEIVGETD